MVDANDIISFIVYSDIKMVEPKGLFIHESDCIHYLSCNLSLSVDSEEKNNGSALFSLYYMMLFETFFRFLSEMKYSDLQRLFIMKLLAPRS